MITTKELESREALYRSRHKLNAEGYDGARPTHGPFVTEEFVTGARTKNGNLYFGKLAEYEDLLLPAKATINWDQPRGCPRVLDVIFHWDAPQAGMSLRPVEHELFVSVNAEFQRPADSMRVESFYNRTRITFGQLAVDECRVYVEPVEAEWDATEPNFRLAQDLLVTEHLDKIIVGKVGRVVEGEIPLVA